MAFTASILRWIFPLEKSTDERPNLAFLEVFVTFSLRLKVTFMAFTGKNWRPRAPIVGGKGQKMAIFVIFKNGDFLQKSAETAEAKALFKGVQNASFVGGKAGAHAPGYGS